MVQSRKPTGDIANGTAKRDQPGMSFQRKDAADGRPVGGNPNKGDSKIQNGNRSGGFRTDAAISNNRPGGERALQRWVPDASVQDLDGSLEASVSTSHRPWDQFAENERKFGIKTSYDEAYYTTAIDKSHPQYAQRMAAADKKAREIERSAAATSHVAEERVVDFAGGNDQEADEEDKYSGVRRQDFPPLGGRDNKYTPPARRAPTGQATVVGAPVDPAIISSQLKGGQTKKQPTPKPEDSKPQTPSGEKAPPATAQNKTTDGKAEVKPEAGAAEATAAESEPADQTGSAEKAATGGAGRAPGSSRTATPKAKENPPAPNASSTVEADVLKHFKSFATQQRVQAEKVRSNKLKADTQVKLQELKKFAESFKLSTPVPNDLISIIAKDPSKQKQIQAKAIQNAADVQKAKETVKDKEVVGTADVPPKPATMEQAAAPAPGPGPGPAAAPESRANASANANANANANTNANANANARPAAPQHTPSPSGMHNNRHPNARQPYAPQNYQQQSFRNDRPPAQHAGQGRGGGATGHLADRLRKVEQDRYNRPGLPHQPHQHHQHHQQHHQDLRLAPTGPASLNSGDPNYGRRLSAVPAAHMVTKLNPNSNEFRPNPFTPSFNPNGPSAGSSPRSAINHAVVEPQPSASPQAGQLIRRKTKAVDVKKCFILAHIKTIAPLPGRNFDENNGLRPSYDTAPTWRQLQDEEKADSNMHLTYKDICDRMVFISAAVPTPNPPHALPHIAHQHQLPFHLQQSSHGLPRQSPHMAAMQMHGGQHGHVPQVPFSSGDDHRMMHSNSAQSFASPRMAPVPIYQQQMNSPAQVPYNQPSMPQFLPSTPQMNHQFRNFSNSPQYMPQQTAAMGMPMMPPQQFVGGPNAVIPSGPQIPMFPGGHPQYMQSAAAAPQQMPGANGFPSPGRPPTAPMMVQQGSQQGQMYGVSPSMQFQQPAYAAHHPGQIPMRGYSNPGPGQYGTSPQHMHQYGGQHRSGSNSYNKGYQGHQHQGPQGGHAMMGAGQSGPDEAK